MTTAFEFIIRVRRKKFEAETTNWRRRIDVSLDFAGTKEILFENCFSVKETGDLSFCESKLCARTKYMQRVFPDL